MDIYNILSVSEIIALYEAGIIRLIDVQTYLANNYSLEVFQGLT